jgi:carbon dioxide concentrating mechanism protein CcmO
VSAASSKKKPAAKKSATVPKAKNPVKSGPAPKDSPPNNPPNQAIGILEVRGMAALMAATDAMLKTARVSVCGRHDIGSGWLTVVIEGDIAAIEAALKAGVQATRRYGELISAEIVARPEAQAQARLPHRFSIPIQKTAAAISTGALGLIETKGLMPLLKAADAAVKAANVDLVGWTYIGGALVHLVLRGDVAAVQAAIKAGVEAAEKAGEMHATLLLPRPEPGLAVLLPPAPAAAASRTGALGVLETTGYVGAVAGSDAMVKAAAIEVLRLTLASGGRVGALVKGNIDDVQTALEAGAQAAGRVGEFEGTQMVARPDDVVMAAFGGSVPADSSGGKGAMGLLETRSTIALVKGLDRMLKTADVDCEGSYKVGYFLTASVIRGDTGAVAAALEAGVAEARKYGDSVASHLIPNPYGELEARLAHH